MNTFFITGTDTEVGKTVITVGLMKKLQDHVEIVNGLKPIASDAARVGSGALRNDDALQIQSQCSDNIPYEQLNPICFEPAIAPHIAASQANQTLSVQTLEQQLNYPQSDVLLIEGAGGWLTPLNDKESYADWVESKGFPVILVVGMKLGCLNHALLTAENIRARGLSLAGWVSNVNDSSMEAFTDNVAFLEQALNAPCLGKVPYINELTPENVAKYLYVKSLHV